MGAAAGEVGPSQVAQEPASRRRHTFWSRLGRHGPLLAILLLAAALRLHHMTADGLWIDELFPLQFSSGYGWLHRELPRDTILSAPPRVAHLQEARPIHQIPRALADEVHPPLYFLCLRLWRDLFGSSDAALRSVALACSLASVALLYGLARLLFPDHRSVAIWSSLLFALARPQIWYAQEVRPYTMLIACSLGMCVAIVRIERFGFSPRRGLALGACALAAMLTHYFAVAPCIAAAAYALIRLTGPARRGTVVSFAAAAATWLLLWSPGLFRQLRTTAPVDPAWLLDAGPGFLARWMTRVALAPANLFAAPPTSDHAIASAAVLMILLPALLLRRSPALQLPWIGAVVCIAIPAAIDLARQTRVLEYERYYLVGGPFLYLLVSAMLTTGASASTFPRRLAAHALPAALTLYCLLALPSAYTYHKDDYRAPARDLASRLNDGDLVIFVAPTTQPWRSTVLYLSLDHYAPPSLKYQAIFLDHPPSDQLLRQIAAAPAVHLFADFTADDPDARIRGLRRLDLHAYPPTAILSRLVPDAPPSAPMPP